MKISEFMIRDVVQIEEHVTIKDLLEILVANKIGGVPVVDKQGVLQGMISDGDVIRFLQPQGRTIYDIYTLVLVSERQDLKDKLKSSIHLPVEDMMRKQKLYTVKPTDNLEKALEILAEHGFKKIPVVNDAGRVVGVISRGDLIRYISNQLIRELD
ncbi:CBS domain-containing protein [Sediminibacillus halophilus]|uniref:CBS domain-containing protein n=1 Tax=Sediminibacillus halophilus TaxID=482461 RepID=A0A1G9M7T2_9BACI|nr:CBS domain-containing protein [Sediminibacillus halophilus]SDL70296.1 CBS domain-containing protein [Sediminibacillus halophilus]